jgi:hypothetical protein
MFLMLLLFIPLSHESHTHTHSQKQIHKQNNNTHARLYLIRNAKTILSSQMWCASLSKIDITKGVSKFKILFSIFNATHFFLLKYKNKSKHTKCYFL